MEGCFGTEEDDCLQALDCIHVEDSCGGDKSEDVMTDIESLSGCLKDTYDED